MDGAYGVDDGADAHQPPAIEDPWPSLSSLPVTALHYFPPEMPGPEWFPFKDYIGSYVPLPAGRMPRQTSNRMRPPPEG